MSVGGISSVKPINEIELKIVTSLEDEGRMS
jgi:hypothetical protein